MTIILFRVDERLVHGQVTAGWGRVLQPSRIVIINDSIAAENWERELIRPAVPEGVEFEVLTVGEAVDKLREYEESRERVFVLVEDLETVTVLVEKGARIRSINLGGIYHEDGREEILPYLYLNPEDKERLFWLGENGMVITVQDVPSARPVDVFKYIRKKEEGSE
ncbi:MAG: PTS system mannose/fructose/N-acetylgalactosamine-transporter subunit IIB [Candidatus Glassbacteria bacterium]